MLQHLRRLARRSAATLGAAAGLALAAAPAHAQFSSLTFFGDSFTDTGNGDLLSGTILGTDFTPSPPYAPGVASNGPVWAQVLATALARPFDAAPSFTGGNNFAIGTARTGLTGGVVPPGSLGPLPPGTPLPVGMQTQLGVHNGVCPPLVPCPPARATDPTGLYVIFGGGNDLGDAALLPTDAERAAAAIQAADNIANIATVLYAQGARRFLIPNLPDLGRFPGVGGTPAQPLGTALTNLFNARLGLGLGALNMLPGTSVFALNTNALFANILADAATGGTRYGITNTTLPCLAAPFGVGLPCETALFADAQHPTARVHALLGGAAARLVTTGVNVTPIPEPGTIALVAGGLAVLGAGAARRRRAA
jgi:outer membrane lipase/esterase